MSAHSRSELFGFRLSLLQNPFFRESKRNRMEHEYESEREPRSILQVPRLKGIPSPLVGEG